MINGINYLQNAQVTMKQAPKTNEEVELKEQKSFVSKPNNAALDALSNYGKSMVNFSNKLDVEPLLPTVFASIDNVQGERIYSSDGKLHSIVNETSQQKTTYYVPVDNQEVIDYIETIDKKTGNVVRNQHNQFDENGKNVSTCITTFNPKTGKEEMFTCYENGELGYAGKTYENNKGEEIYITKDYQANEYRVTQENKKTNTNKYMFISDDMKQVDYTEQRNFNGSSFECNVTFYEGLPFNYSETKTATFPNFLALAPLSDPDLKPAPKFDFKAMEKDIRKTQGEEKRYSNGSLESKKVVIDGETVEAFFNPNNEITRVVYDYMEIEADGKDVIRVKQQLEDGATKETYMGNEVTTIVHSKNGYVKTLMFDSKTQKPVSYTESEAVDGNVEFVKSYDFNKNGMVEKVYK